MRKQLYLKKIKKKLFKQINDGQLVNERQILFLTVVYWVCNRRKAKRDVRIKIRKKRKNPYSCGFTISLFFACFFLLIHKHWVSFLCCEGIEKIARIRFLQFTSDRVAAIALNWVNFKIFSQTFNSQSQLSWEKISFVRST